MTNGMDRRNEQIAETIYRNSIILIHHAAVDITGDIIAGALLDRIVALLSVSRPENHTLVYKNGYTWLVMVRADWGKEIRLSTKQYDRASKLLVELNLIVVERWKYDGVPMLHIRVNYDEYGKQIQRWKAHEIMEMQKKGGANL